MLRRVFILTVASLVAGCATPRNDLVIVLPEQDGKVGAVVVDDGKRETVLHTPYASVRTERDGMQATTSNAEQVRIARSIIEGLGLAVATPDEARGILALKGADQVAF